ncbi:glycosyltransferase family 4 protein [Paracoccus pacificus]|uniref:Glycosyltransferase family 4 protein n=1 Tax=Paracoccus pacificus TaxID=1463598 RepID=A0ABW4R226_9RHOB
MKIAIISHHAVSLIGFRGTFIKELVARGHQVLALAPDYKPKTREVVRGMGAETIGFNLSRTGVSPKQDLATLFELRRILRDHGPDLVLSFSTKPSIYGTLAALSAGVPRRFAMVEGLGSGFAQPGAPQSLAKRALGVVLRRMYGFALARADGTIFLNRDDYAEFAARRLVPRGRGHVLGGIGVALDQFPQSSHPTDPVVFVLIARMLREKGVGYFVEAARRIHASHPGAAEFVLVGGLDRNPTGHRRAHIREWVREGIVKWTGHVPVGPILRQSSVFVLPSFYREGVPRSTQEAMASGLPVITTDVPGCRETVDHGVNGFLVPPHDVDALTRRMRHFIENPGDISRMGSESRRLAERDFDAKLQDARLIGLLGLS